MTIESITSILGIITTILGGVRWLVNKAETALKRVVESEVSDLRTRVTNAQSQILLLQKINEDQTKELKEIRSSQVSNRIMLGEMSAEIRTSMSEHGSSIRRLEKSSTEWINSEFVKIKGKP